MKEKRLGKVHRINGDVTNLNISSSDTNSFDNGNPTIRLEDIPFVDVEVEEGEGFTGKHEMPVMPDIGGETPGGGIHIKGKDKGKNNFIVADGTTVRGVDNIVQEKLESIQLNKADEDKKLNDTKRNYSRLPRALRGVEDKTTMRDLLVDLRDAGHFVTAEFLVREYMEATKDDGKTDWDGARNFAKLLIEGGHVNNDNLVAKLHGLELGENGLNSAQNILQDVLKDISK
jgi:hypothetical protein